MSVDPDILDWHAEIAAEALDSISFQSSAASRFLRRGDHGAALDAYRRIVALHREFAAPGMKVLAKADDDRLSASLRSVQKPNEAA